MELNFKVIKEENVIKIPEDFFDGSIDVLTKFFVSNEEIKELQYYITWDDNGETFTSELKRNDSIICLLNDVSKYDSCLDKMFIESLGNSINKIDIAKTVIKGILEFELGINRSNDRSSYDAFYGTKRLNFRVEIPKDVLKKYYSDESMWFYHVGPVEFNLNKLTLEERIKSVIVPYYIELGMWDREKLRNDKEEMKYLRDNWFNTLEARIA